MALTAASSNGTELHQNTLPARDLADSARKEDEKAKVGQALILIRKCVCYSPMFYSFPVSILNSDVLYALVDLLYLVFRPVFNF